MTQLKRLIYSSDTLTRRWNETRLNHIDRRRHRVREDKFGWLTDATLSEGVILDVGANYGQSAIAIRLARPDREVICIEANPELQPSLRKLSLRDPMIGYVLAAAGDLPGFLSLKVPKFHGSHNTGGASIDESFVRRRGDELEARYGAEMELVEHLVPVMKLDDLPHEIAAIKIDVEGLEDAVLAGLTKTLESRPPVLIEVLHSDGAAMRRLEAVGYRLFSLGPHGVTSDQVTVSEALQRGLQDVLALAAD